MPLEQFITSARNQTPKFQFPKALSLSTLSPKPFWLPSASETAQVEFEARGQPYRADFEMLPGRHEGLSALRI